MGPEIDANDLKSKIKQEDKFQHEQQQRSCCYSQFAYEMDCEMIMLNSQKQTS